MTPSGRLGFDSDRACACAHVWALDEEAENERETSLFALEESRFHLTTGFVGTPYINHVLSQHGMHDAAYKLFAGLSFLAVPGYERRHHDMGALGRY